MLRLATLIGLIAFVICPFCWADGGADYSAAETELISRVRSGENTHDRIVAARQIGMLHDDRFLDVLCEALTDGSIELRLVAVRAIAELGTRLSVSQLGDIAGSETQDLLVRAEACEKLNAFALRSGKPWALVPLSVLSSTSEANIKKAAITGLRKAVAAYDSSSLSTLVASNSDALKAIIRAEQSRRAHGSAVGETSESASHSASAVGPSEFSESDMKVLGGWQRAQAASLQARITAQAKGLANARTEYQKNAQRKSMMTLNASLNSVRSLSPAEVGVAMERQAHYLVNQSEATAVASQFIGAVSKDMINTPGDVYVDRFGRFYQEDNTGPGMIGMLFALGADMESRRAAEESRKLREALDSLSPSAKAAISRRANEDASAAKSARTSGPARTR